MEGEQLSGDEISPDTSQLNPEIGREEGQGSWDELEIEPEEESASEIESGKETQEDQIENKPKEEPEEEEEEQKNTLSDSSPRVLSFKDFFNKN
jgi:hypothetical protein